VAKLSLELCVKVGESGQLLQLLRGPKFLRGHEQDHGEMWQCW
jgi:hypothetical protein